MCRVSTDLESATEKMAKQLEAIVPKTRKGCIVKVAVEIGKPYQQII
jgi:hypothetical protein